MSRHRAAAPAVSLFPFLAVLLCTMGALLVLLVLFGRAAEDAERADAQEAAQALAVELEQAREELSWRLEQLALIRQQTSDDLARARMQLAGVEDDSRRLADELDALEQAYVAMELRQDPADDAAERLAELEAQLAEARQALEALRAEGATRPPAYAVVPYQGAQGTHRRPIYIECCIDGVFLQPEGIRLGPSDFEGPPGPGNPLASALRAAREHIALSAPLAGDPDAQPYPLLLVRPSGVMAYYAAREAIQSWGSEFGYQFIDEDWQLQFPPPDTALADAERRAVDEARQRLAWLAQVRPMRPARPPQHYRAATTRGGVVAEGGPSVLGDRSRYDWNDPSARGQAGASSGASSGASTSGGGDGAADRGGVADAVAAGSRWDELPDAGPGRGMVAGPGGAGDGPSSGGWGTASGGGPGRGGPGDPQPMASGSGLPGGPNATSDSVVDEAGQFAGGEGGRGGPHAFGGTSTAGGRDPSQADSGEPGAADGGPSAGAASTGVAASSSGTDGSSRAAGGGGGGTSMPGMASSGDQPQAAGGSTAQAAVNASASVSLAGQRGTNWASLATHDRPIPLTRPIRLECAADEFRLLGDDGRVEERIAIGTRTADAVDPLVRAVHQKVDRWGFAGNRMYWRPVLVLSTTLDGVSRRDDLERLLADSGLDTQRSTVPESVRPLPPVSRATRAVRPTGP